MLDDDYYLWGAGLYGARLIELMKEDLAFKAVIDNDLEKQGTLFHGLPVVTYNDIKENLPKNKIVMTMNLPREVRAFLISEGYKDNEDFYYIIDFLPRYYWIKKRKLVVKAVDIPVTTVCNMKCDGCQTFIHIGKNPRHLRTDDVICDIDRLFTHIDYVLNLNICVGESLLNPELSVICAYANAKYSEKYRFLTVQTNCTIVPDDNTLKRLSDAKTVFGVSKYPETAGTREKLIEKLNEHNISWYLNMQSDREIWFDYGDPRIVQETDVGKLQTKYANCYKPANAVVNGLLYLCQAQAWAHLVAESGTPEPCEVFDLHKEKSEATREEVYDIITRQSNKGYISHCMSCNSIIQPLSQKKA